MNSYLIKGATIVNEGKQFVADVLIRNGIIEKINPSISHPSAEEINAEGLYLFPGMIDDQVHFREPGLTHKGDIFSESMAAVAGGITSFMEMPNTVPNTLTQALLEDKYAIAGDMSLANYSFFMGASNDNIEEVLKTNPKNVCGIKVFMGSSTGNMLVDNTETLSNIFEKVPMLIATHCEDEAIIRQNLQAAQEKYGENIPVEMHPIIRNAEACYKSSSAAVELAKKHNTRLHILHISTEKELSLFSDAPISPEKRITAEACVHHLWFTDEDYASKGNFIKWNPAVKSKSDRLAIREAIKSNKIDVIATDHAPHTLEEKSKPYSQSPSGGPLVQHALPALLDLYHEGVFTLDEIVNKTAHSPAICFNINKRGFIREGYWADLTLISLNDPFKVTKANILYKCNWSPFEGHTFKSSIEYTFVSGNLAYSKGKFTSNMPGQRLEFNA